MVRMVDGSQISIQSLVFRINMRIAPMVVADEGGSFFTTLRLQDIYHYSISPAFQL